MRNWLGKPLLILAGIVAVLLVASALYLRVPGSAQAAASSGESVHQRQVDQACRLMEEH